jgi:hypothetical protein
LKFLEDARAEARRRFENRYKDWLCCELGLWNGPSLWPMDLNLAIPAEQDAQQQLEGVQSWIRSWCSWKGPGDLVWIERRWRALGTQSVPERLVFRSADELADFVELGDRWARMRSYCRVLLEQWPQLHGDLLQFVNALSNLDSVDFSRLVNMLRWISNHPDSGLYLRQLPIAGMDTKWVEQRSGLISSLLAAIQGKDRASGDLYELCGLQALPQCIRIRLLDPALRSMIGGLGDISAPIDQIASWNISPPAVLIVENVQSGLAFRDIPGTVVLMGLGYSVNALERLPWLNRASCVYWGDLDTHGFAILNRARTYIPDLKSVLMDQQTLMAHRELWGVEKDQSPAEQLSLLTKPEADLYRALKENRWGSHIRLEQERLGWEYVEVSISRKLRFDGPASDAFAKS